MTVIVFSCGSKHGRTNPKSGEVLLMVALVRLSGGSVAITLSFNIRHKVHERQ